MQINSPFRSWVAGAAALVLGAGAASAHEASPIEGTWMPERTSERLLAADGSEPPLTPEGAALYQERIAASADRDRQYDRTHWCAGPGMPRIMFLPYPFEIRADGDYVGFIHGWYRWHRMVDMSGQPADPILPQTMGYPVGKWEGDALVIETVGTGDETILDAMGLPQSEDLVLTERLSVLPDKRLEVRFTMTDPVYYSRPWEAVMTYRPAPEITIGDDVCPDRLVRGDAPIRSNLP